MFEKIAQQPANQCNFVWAMQFQNQNLDFPRHKPLSTLTFFTSGDWNATATQPRKQQTTVPAVAIHNVCKSGRAAIETKKMELVNNSWTFHLILSIRLSLAFVLQYEATHDNDTTTQVNAF